jgi:hypothetical protein
MFAHRRSPSDVLTEWRLPREQRKTLRAARKREKLEAIDRGRAGALDAEARHDSSFQGRP